MQFLKEYWANLAEVGEEPIRQQQEEDIVRRLANEEHIDEQLAREDQSNIDTSGFQ
jgi:hypothetical protein